MNQRTCAACGAPFVSNHSASRYCAARCRNRAKYERQKTSGVEQAKRERRNAKYVPRRPRFKGECQVCETPFDSHQANKKYCSVDCRRLASWRRDARRDRDRKMLHVPIVGVRTGLIGVTTGESMRTGGIVVHCPAHPGERFWMGYLRELCGPDELWCSCGVIVYVDPDEIQRLMDAQEGGLRESA